MDNDKDDGISFSDYPFAWIIIPIFVFFFVGLCMTILRFRRRRRRATQYQQWPGTTGRVVGPGGHIVVVSRRGGASRWNPWQTTRSQEGLNELGRHRRKSQPEDGDNKDKPAGEKEPSAKQPQDVPSPPAPASPVTNARGSLVADEPSALRHPGLAAVAAEMRDPVSAVSAVGARGSVLTDDKVSQIRPASGTIGKGASTTTKGGLVSRIKSTRTFGWGFGKNEEEKVGGDVQPPHETPEARAERYAQLRKQYEETLADFPYPERMSRRARSICEQLLQMDPSKRLGARGAQEVKSHPFFEGISWHQLKERHITPPFIPERDYVNAKFLEAAAGAFSSKPKKNQKAVNFQNFDFIRPAVFQEEVMQSIHDKDALVGPD